MLGTLNMRLLWAAILCLINATNGVAWHECGHHIIAIMAFEKLDAAEQEKLLQILREHPRFAEDFKVPSECKREDHFLIGTAGYWPDIARQTDYDRPTWHYALGITDKMGDGVIVIPEPREPMLKQMDLDFQDMHIEDAVATCMRVLGDASKPSADRALAICWLCHLVADAHQPCHAGSFYVPKVFPEGDRGATRIKIRPDSNLHAVWDGLLGGEYDADVVTQAVAELSDTDMPGERLSATEELLNAAEFSERSGIELWIAESKALAQSYVYDPTVREPISIALRSDQSNVDALTLGAPYLSAANRMAKLRARKAAARLAEVLSACIREDAAIKR